MNHPETTLTEVHATPIGDGTCTARTMSYDSWELCTKEGEDTFRFYLTNREALDFARLVMQANGQTNGGTH